LAASAAEDAVIAHRLLLDSGVIVVEVHALRAHDFDKLAMTTDTLASALPYPSLNTPRLERTMKLGGHYRLRDIGTRELRKLATGTRQDPDAVIERARALCARVPDIARDVHAACSGDGLTHPILKRLMRALGERAKHCAEQLR
jgi:hypothetical protein